MSEGWIKLHRALLESKVWEYKPFSWGQAWVDLLMLANHKPGSIWPRGIETPINRGQVGYSSVKLGVRWGWSRTKVRLFLKCLENEQQIEQQNNNVSLVITITNYEKYQENEQQNEQQKNSRRTAEEQQKNTNKNVKNEKNTSFDEFWSLYPKKVGKGAALKAWTSRHCENGLIDKIRSTLAWEVKSEQWQKESGQFIPLPATWLNQERWNDEPTTEPTKQRKLVL